MLSHCLPAAVALSLVFAAGAAQPQPGPVEPAVKATAAEIPFAPLGHIEKRGTGPVPVVLVPGWGCDWTVFESFMDRNAEKYTMYAVTLPGFGGTASPLLPDGTPTSDDIWLRNAEAAVVKLVEERKLDKPLLIGHSLGGHLAFRLAGHKPEHFRGAISLDGMIAFPLGGPMKFPKEQRQMIVEQMARPQLEAMSEDDWDQMSETMMSSMITNQDRAKVIGDRVKGVPATVRCRYLLELLASDPSDEIKELKIPVLAIAAFDEQEPGVGDQLRAFWQEMIEGLDKVQVVFFEGAKHFITEDAPAELDEAVGLFVAGKPAESKTIKHGAN